MMRPDPLQPAYDFSSTPDPVTLLRGAVEVGLGNDRFTGRLICCCNFFPAHA